MNIHCIEINVKNNDTKYRLSLKIFWSVLKAKKDLLSFYLANFSVIS